MALNGLLIGERSLVLHVQQNVVLNHELWLVVVLVIHLGARSALLAVAALLQVKRAGRVQFVQFAARIGAAARRVLAGVHQTVRCAADRVSDRVPTQIALSPKVLAAFVAAVRLLVGVRK